MNAKASRIGLDGESEETEETTNGGDLAGTGSRDGGTGGGGLGGVTTGGGRGQSGGLAGDDRDTGNSGVTVGGGLNNESVWKRSTDEDE